MARRHGPGYPWAIRLRMITMNPAESAFQRATVDASADASEEDYPPVTASGGNLGEVRPQLMIRIRYSPAGCVVAGSPAELGEVAGVLRRLAGTGGEQILVCEAGFDPAPFRSRLGALVVRNLAAKDRISTQGGALVIAGTTDGLRRVASYFEVPGGARDGLQAHHHPSFSPTIIAEDSLPLVVRVERGPARHAVVS